MLDWHPRDLDTLEAVYRDAEEEASLQAQRDAIRAQGLGQA
jgi:hypothetical protein